MIFTSLRLIKRIFGPAARPAFALPAPTRMEAQDTEKAFVRTFSTDDGQKVLAYLNGQTFMRAAAMDASDESLRYLEGQRSLLAQILRMIERGKAQQKPI